MSEKPAVLLLHGFMGNRDVSFFPFLRDVLAERAEVISPSLPNPNEPIYEEWASLVQEICADHTILLTIAHSLGGTLAMNLIC